MDGNNVRNTLEPLFYIIQPDKKSKLVAKNMQEIYHSKSSILEEEVSNNQEIKAKEDEYKEELQIVEETIVENTDIINENHEISEFSQNIDELNSEHNREIEVEKDNQKEELRTKLIRLARYPAVVKRPLCELKVDGKTITGQIESKRGELLKIRVDGIIRMIAIDDIEELSILN